MGESGVNRWWVVDGGGGRERKKKGKSKILENYEMIINKKGNNYLVRNYIKKFDHVDLIWFVM